VNQLAIAFEDDRKTYRPREVVRGRALWILDAEPARIEIRLFWHTSGQGDRSLEVVGTVGFDAPAAVGEHAFELELPDRPWSFSGKLISLQWSLEIVALPSEESNRFDFVVGPDGVEVQLHRTPPADA
jgi:hypothetical protein